MRCVELCCDANVVSLVCAIRYDTIRCGAKCKREFGCECNCEHECGYGYGCGCDGDGGYESGWIALQM